MYVKAVKTDIDKKGWGERERENEREKHSTARAAFSEVEIGTCTAYTHKINLHPTIALQFSLDISLFNLR